MRVSSLAYTRGAFDLSRGREGRKKERDLDEPVF